VTSRDHRDPSRDGGSRRRLVLGLTLAAAVGGASAVGIAIAAQDSPPSTTAAGTPDTAPFTSDAGGGRRDGAAAAAQGSTGSAPVARSRPTHIEIPAIGVDAAVFAIGKAADGTLAVPQPGPNLDKAAWYHGSATPGQDGPAVIEGHVDSDSGPSVFYRLGSVSVGDKVRVDRMDGATAVYVVDAVRTYATHADFPTLGVFASPLDRPTIRLITCSNFDSSIGHYVGNTVVFGHLTHFHRS
jgi:LPXTG-site transpeptidase (sortase) family protein